MRLAIYTIGGLEAPSTRFRILQYMPFFEKEGIHVRLFSLPFPRGGKLIQWWGLFAQAVTRLCQLALIRNYDVILIQKGLTPWRCRGLLSWVLKSGKTFIYDIDDAIYAENPIRLPGFFRRFQEDQEPQKLMKHSSVVIAGNQFLASEALRHNPEVVIIPTSLDIDLFHPKPSKEKRQTVIGWSGSSSTNRYVNELIPVLNRVAEDCSFSLLLISNDLRDIQTERMKGYEFRFLPWDKNQEVENLQKIDIGLMPLPDDPWTRGKCPTKALQYMAIGIPSVCAAVGMNLEIIKDGTNGFLAGSPDEWGNKIRYLIQNPDHWNRIGGNARSTVEREYSIQAHWPGMNKILKGQAKKV